MDLMNKETRITIQETTRYTVYTAHVHKLNYSHECIKKYSWNIQHKTCFLELKQKNMKLSKTLYLLMPGNYFYYLPFTGLSVIH